MTFTVYTCTLADIKKNWMSSSDCYELTEFPPRRRISEDISKQSPDLRPRSQVIKTDKEVNIHFPNEIEILKKKKLKV